MNFLFLLILMVMHNREILGIVSSKYAKLGEFPFQVSLKYISKDKHFCGGSIYDNNYVITAAHCVSGKNRQDIKIVAGTINLNKTGSGHVHMVDDVIIPYDYQHPHMFSNEIALIKVRPPFQLTEGGVIDKVILPPRNYKLSVNQKVRVAGFGMTEGFNSAPSNKLKKAKMYVVDREDCKAKYKSVFEKLSVAFERSVDLTDKEFCTANKKVFGREGTCTGDSGGPVTDDTKKILLGIISWSNKNDDLKCADPKYPDIHTQVADYVDWIRSIAG